MIPPIVTTGLFTTGQATTGAPANSVGSCAGNLTCPEDAQCVLSFCICNNGFHAVLNNCALNGASIASTLSPSNDILMMLASFYVATRYLMH